jgi:hypothetical protein
LVKKQVNASIPSVMRDLLYSKESRAMSKTVNQGPALKRLVETEWGWWKVKYLQDSKNLSGRRQKKRATTF